ncbi:MAG: IMP dehydrogenase [Candidatus Woykebacteria bacterium]
MAGRFKGLALTFDDILLEPQDSSVLPSQVRLETQITKKIKINIPIISAASDTVTESSMAIAMARAGGLGVIHRNLSIEDQAKEVRLVKRSESSLIQEPITLRPQASLQEALEVMSTYKISGVPVVNDNKLKGIISGRDLRLEADLTKKVSEVMTKEGLITAKQGTTLEEAEKIFKKHKIEKLPIVDKEGKLNGLITWRDLNKIREFPLACKDKYGRLLVAAAIGVGEDMESRVGALVNEGVDILVIDTAHGHHKNVVSSIPFLKKTFPKVQIIAGNIATREAAESLIKKGADAVKIGVGSGSICSTRDVAGVGVPQFTAVLECAKVANRYKVPVVADGGLVYPGDMVKALAAGASCVMLGNMLAGTDESPGEVIINSDGRRFKSYRGMGSFEAIKVRGHDRYFQKEVEEGVSARVSYKGSVINVVRKLSSSLKTAMGYFGAKEIGNLWVVKYWQITGAGIRESHPHSVILDSNTATFN